MKLWEWGILAIISLMITYIAAGYIAMWVMGADSITFTVNTFHEQAIETVMMVAVSILGLVTSFRYLKRLWRE